MSGFESLYVVGCGDRKLDLGVVSMLTFQIPHTHKVPNSSCFFFFCMNGAFSYSTKSSSLCIEKSLIGSDLYSYIHRL